MNPINNLSLTVSAELLPKFFQLLEQGFLVETSVGCSLRDFICGGLGLDGQYLADRVQTIFLDHNPVDDIDTALIQENSTVALSAAMPGLAGATLRKGGRFAAMRNQITCRTGTACESDQRTKVTVKFFNVIAKDLGGNLLNKGIRIQDSNFIWFANKHTEAFQAHIRSARLDGKTIDPHTLASIPRQGDLFLQAELC
ncbi:MAG: hypothetical protein P1P89_08345 [Desulfobacterales bacterium]|nr:hypothetical protein [Desulfobacterales bacterium]